jgi:hypothetical protein
MYKTGGLEPVDDATTMNVDGINYVVSDKFRMMLRDSFIDWGTFLDIYNDNLDYATLFDQMVKLLNIKENENLREFMIPLVIKIYELPVQAHITCMLKQFIIYEPVSIAIHSLFTTFKLFYEHIVELFITTRNRYIELNNTKDTLNDLQALKKYWSDMNEQYNLDSSSIVLLFINPPTGLKSGINFNVKNLSNIINTLKIAVKKFHYPGFCPKVPNERLTGLLNFPISEFINAIKELDNSVEFPDFDVIERIIKEHLDKMPEAPTIPDVPALKDRETPPDGLDQISLAKWYIEAILELRKKLLPYGNKYEEYYVQKARIFTDLTNAIKAELNHLH